jgi:hypothetical protein
VSPELGTPGPESRRPRVDDPGRSRTGPLVALENPKIVLPEDGLPSSGRREGVRQYSFCGWPDYVIDPEVVPEYDPCPRAVSVAPLRLTPALAAWVIWTEKKYWVENSEADVQAEV